MEFSLMLLDSMTSIMSFAKHVPTSRIGGQDTLAMVKSYRPLRRVGGICQF